MDGVEQLLGYFRWHQVERLIPSARCRQLCHELDRKAREWVREKAWIGVEVVRLDQQELAAFARYDDVPPGDAHVSVDQGCCEDGIVPPAW
jgi:hypothetical protein